MCGQTVKRGAALKSGHPQRKQSAEVRDSRKILQPAKLRCCQVPCSTHPPVMNSRPLSASYAMPFSTSGPPLRAAAAGLPTALAATTFDDQSPGNAGG